jgi:hypothetical protein
MNRTIVACILHKHTDCIGWQTRYSKQAAERVDRLHKLASMLHGDRPIFWAITWSQDSQFTFVHCHAISNCREDALNHFMDLMTGSGIHFELLTDAPHNVVESTHA